MTPVPELYEIPVPPERDVEEILLLKVVKSVAERYPLAPVVAWLIARVPALKVSGEETVVAATTPEAFVERSAEGTPVRPRVVVVALVAMVLPKVWVPAQVLLVVVPKARAMTEPETVTG